MTSYGDSHATACHRTTPYEFFRTKVCGAPPTAIEGHPTVIEGASEGSLSRSS
jgi:hypothetical protein